MESTFHPQSSDNTSKKTKEYRTKEKISVRYHEGKGVLHQSHGATSQHQQNQTNQMDVVKTLTTK